MSSSYSPDLRIELIGTGDQAGVWGATTNVNLGSILETAIAGYTSVSILASPQPLIANDGAIDEARYAAIALTTTTGANFTVTIPPNSKLYTFYNASSYTATISNSTAVNGVTLTGGTTVAIPAGKTSTVWSDGTNVYFQNTHTGSLTLATALPVTSGGTGTTTSTGSGNVVLSASPTFTGTPVSTTAAAKDSTTQVATDEFVDRLRSFLTGSTGGTASVTDRGCLLVLTSGITINPGTFAANDAFTIFNNTGSTISVTQGSGLTMYWAGPGITGTRTLSARGLCTVIFIGSGVCVISGAGLS